MATAAYTVSGMTCGHCVATVRSTLSALPGVTGVDIELVPDGDSAVSVDSTEPLARHAVRSAIATAGFVLTG